MVCARERGEFDNLPGAGKPIPNIRRRDDNWWVKGLLERENIAPLLPTSLSLRKEALEIVDAVADVRTEEDVREIVADLNQPANPGHLAQPVDLEDWMRRSRLVEVTFLD